VPSKLFVKGLLKVVPVVMTGEVANSDEAVALGNANY
jgi:hypothetical protein